MGSVGAKDVPVLLTEDGKRIDGRRLDELRSLKIVAGALKQADGSAFVEWGANKVMAAVYGPREVHPRHLQQNNKAIVQCRYNMAAFSVDERKRPGLDRRSQEISKVIAEAFESVIFVEEYPRTSIDVYIEVLQANAGTRCAGIVAASVALADAGIPMVDLLPAVAVGKVAGAVALDLKKEEDNFGEADLPMALVPQSGRLVLLQMEGHMTAEELSRSLDLGVQGCREIYEKMKQALRDRYQVGGGGGGMTNEVTSEILATHILDLARQGKRLDGRGLDEYRTVSIELGFVASADGSTLARIGDSAVVCGVKLEPGKPFPDTPNAGVLTTNAELVPLSNPTFEPGPPHPRAIEVSRVIDRAIRAAETIDLTKLCVTPAEKCWTCFVDVHVIDHSGNLIDTGSLAALSALARSTVPAKRFGIAESDYKLEIRHHPIETTFVRLGEAIAVDPSFDEELACQGRLTVATDEAGNVVAMQKGLIGAFSPDDVKSLVDRAFRHGERMRKIALGA